MTEQPGITCMNSHVTKEWSAVRLWLSAIAVFLIAFVVRAAFLIRNGVVTTLDTVDYVTIAQNLMGHGVFSLSTSFPYIPTIRRPPLYSFFLAAVSPSLTAILLQVTLDAACALGVYFLTLSAGRIKQALTAGFFETSRSIPPQSHATRRVCSPSSRKGLRRLLPFNWGTASGLGGVQLRQISSSFKTTNRTSVFRRRHLYRTFSKKRTMRLVRSTWLLVRTRRLTGLLKYAISLGNFSSSSCSIASTNSGTARNSGSRTIRPRRQLAW